MVVQINICTSILFYMYMHGYRVIPSHACTSIERECIYLDHDHAVMVYCSRIPQIGKFSCVKDFGFIIFVYKYFRILADVPKM